MPALKQNFLQFIEQCQVWISKTFHISMQEQQQAIDKAKGERLNTLSSVAGTTVSVIGASMASLLLIPVYVFLFLYYRDHLLNFIRQLFAESHSKNVEAVIQEIRSVVQHYVAGLLIETTCVAVLNSIGLIIIGAPYAILLGVIGAILNLIPYIGGLIAVALISLITLTNTGDIYQMIGAFIVYMIVQVIDNNFFVPRIIGSQVKLNALISIVIVLLGGALCGVGGMFLSIPFIAICKVIFSHIDELKAWGYLLGDEQDAA